MNPEPAIGYCYTAEEYDLAEQERDVWKAQAKSKSDRIAQLERALTSALKVCDQYQHACDQYEIRIERAREALNA